MKKTLSAVLVAAALGAPWVAQAQESYVKFGVGQGQYKIEDASADKTAVSLAFGQSLSENWGYEIGYLNFGKWSGSTTVGTATEKISLNAHALYAAAVGTLPINESFSLFGKVGLSANYTKAKFTTIDTGTPPINRSESDSETKIKPMIGIGANFNFTKQIAATLEYQYFGKVVEDLKVGAWTLGLKYGF